MIFKLLRVYFLRLAMPNTRQNELSCGEQQDNSFIIHCKGLPCKKRFHGTATV
jgi:hypothetical protein